LDFHEHFQHLIQSDTGLFDGLDYAMSQVLKKGIPNA
jgi:hypothetical protein